EARAGGPVAVPREARHRARHHRDRVARPRLHDRGELPVSESVLDNPSLLSSFGSSRTRLPLSTWVRPLPPRARTRAGWVLAAGRRDDPARAGEDHRLLRGVGGLLVLRVRAGEDAGLEEVLAEHRREIVLQDVEVLVVGPRRLVPEAPVRSRALDLIA